MEAYPVMSLRLANCLSTIFKQRMNPNSHSSHLPYVLMTYPTGTISNSKVYYHNGFGIRVRSTWHMEVVCEEHNWKPSLTQHQRPWQQQLPLSLLLAGSAVTAIAATITSTTSSTTTTSTSTTSTTDTSTETNCKCCVRYPEIYKPGGLTRGIRFFNQDKNEEQETHQRKKKMTTASKKRWLLKTGRPGLILRGLWHHATSASLQSIFSVMVLAKERAFCLNLSVSFCDDCAKRILVRGWLLNVEFGIYLWFFLTACCFQSACLFTGKSFYNGSLMCHNPLCRGKKTMWWFFPFSWHCGRCGGFALTLAQCPSSH
jgi:hypothetical protein